MKIGLLQLYEVEESRRSVYGRYAEMFSRLLGAGGLPAEWRVYDVLNGEIPQRLDECDGYLIGGSKFAVYEDHAWLPPLFDFIRRQNAAQSPPLAGVCFGHQAVAVALGGAAEKSSRGWGAGRQIWKICGDAEWMRPPLEEFVLLASHQDQVSKLPPEAALLASSEFCPNAAFCIGKHIFCLQGHPEFSPDFSLELLESRRDAMPEDTWRAAKEGARGANTRGACARWLANFFGGKNAADTPVFDII